MIRRFHTAPGHRSSARTASESGGQASFAHWPNCRSASEAGAAVKPGVCASGMIGRAKRKNTDPARAVLNNLFTDAILQGGSL